MKHLSEFIHSFDLVQARPLSDVVEAAPPSTLAMAFGVADEELCVYLADERELPAARDLPDGQEGDPKAGSPIEGTIILNLPEGTYRVSCLDPKTGLYSPALTIQGSQQTRLALPLFVHDLVIRLTRISA